MPRDDDLDRTAAWRALLISHHRALEQIEGALSDSGVIPLTFYDVLLELDRAPRQGLRISNLADRVVLLSRSRVSRLVDELVGRGFVERAPAPEDGRGQVVSITSPGRKALRRAAPVYLEAIEQHFNAHLTDQERKLVAQALQKVASARSD